MYEIILNNICDIYSYNRKNVLYASYIKIRCHTIILICRSEDGDARIDEAEEVRSGDEEAVEPEEEPEGINLRNSNFEANQMIVPSIEAPYDYRGRFGRK